MYYKLNILFLNRRYRIILNNLNLNIIFTLNFIVFMYFFLIVDTKDDIVDFRCCYKLVYVVPKGYVTWLIILL